MAEANPVSLRAALLELPRDVAVQLISDVLDRDIARQLKQGRTQRNRIGLSHLRPLPFGHARWLLSP